MTEKEIAFIGRITAGVTHEVNNVLASIREISGLLSDILSITSEESFTRKEKFETSIQKIQNQEKRGVKLINQLNKFAHLPDFNSTETDLNELIEHLIFLMERFGRNVSDDSEYVGYRQQYCSRRSGDHQRAELSSGRSICCSARNSAESE